MADKIVQLQNKAGDNIYPISRGIAANSVDTAALKDGSVTSDKLDYSSYHWKKLDGKQFSFSTAWTSQNIPDWNITFDTKVGEVYLVILKSNYTAITGSQNETSLKVVATSGGTVQIAANSDSNLSTGIDKTSIAVVTATGTSMTLQGTFMSGSSNVTVRVDSGVFIAIRIG